MKVARFRWFFLALLLVALLGAPFVLPVNDSLQPFLLWIRGLGLWGVALLILFYVVACVLLIPGSLITVASGTLYGLVLGTAAVSVGSTAGACAAFLVGRGLARPWVEKQVSGSPRFCAIDRAVAASGFQVVLLLRLSPVFPFSLLNYALGLTRVRFIDYLLASWIGMFPGTVLYVYLGSTLGELSQLFAGEQEGGPARHVFFFVGLGITAVATVYLTRLARRALHRAVLVADQRDVRDGASIT